MSASLALASAYAAAHPSEVARLLEAASDVERAELLRDLGAPTAAPVLAAATPRCAAEALAQLSKEDAARILETLDSGAAAALLLRLPQAEVAALLAPLSAARSAQLRMLLQYGPACAGGRIDPRAPAVPESVTAAEALRRVLREPEGALYYVYVLDDAQRLVGVINLRELMSAPGDRRVDALMVRSPDRLQADDSLERIARHPAWRRVHALPVVDGSGRFLGALRYAVFRAIEAELGHSVSGPDAGRSASALAELYGLGANALLHLAARSPRSPGEPPKDGS
jgi:magnesium transporter